MAGSWNFKTHLGFESKWQISLWEELEPNYLHKVRSQESLRVGGMGALKFPSVTRENIKAAAEALVTA